MFLVAMQPGADDAPGEAMRPAGASVYKGPDGGMNVARTDGFAGIFVRKQSASRAAVGANSAL